MTTWDWVFFIRINNLIQQIIIIQETSWLQSITWYKVTNFKLLEKLLWYVKFESKKMDKSF